MKYFNNYYMVHYYHQLFLVEYTNKVFGFYGMILVRIPMFIATTKSLYRTDALTL